MKGYVYAIEGGVDGPIKIGWTTHSPHVRLRELQTGNPYALKVWAAVEAEQELEKQLHRLLAPHRLMGEWFEPHEEVVSVVMTLACPESNLLEKCAAIFGSSETMQMMGDWKPRPKTSHEKKSGRGGLRNPPGGRPRKYPVGYDRRKAYRERAAK